MKDVSADYADECILGLLAPTLSLLLAPTPPRSRVGMHTQTTELKKLLQKKGSEE